jgi:hypothetical protein
MKLSLRIRLGLFWLAIVVICIALGMIMHRVYSLGVDAQTARMRDIVQDACETIQRQYRLSLRGLLFTLSNHWLWFVAVQLLDGVGNGLFGALMPLVLNDLMRGTGRYNMAAGAVATIQGLGAALSHNGV